MYPKRVPGVRIPPSPPSLRAATNVAALFFGPASDACIGKQGPKKRERGARPLSLLPPPFREHAQRNPLSAKLKGRNERCGPFFWAGVRCVHRKARPQKKGARSAALELVAPPFREHAQRNPLSAKLKGRNEGCGPFFWRGCVGRIRTEFESVFYLCWPAAGIDEASPQNLRRLAESAPKSDFRSYFGACTAPP